MINTIRNFVALTNNVGTAGQPTTAQFKSIAEAGYESVINLAMPDHPESVANEGQLVASQGMSDFHIPVPFDAPETSQVRQFCRLMEALEGQKIFVHCIMNYRVSAFMFLYLTKVKNYPVESARSPIFERWEVEPQWQEIMTLSAEELELNL